LINRIIDQTGVIHLSKPKPVPVSVRFSETACFTSETETGFANRESGETIPDHYTHRLGRILGDKHYTLPTTVV